MHLVPLFNKTGTPTYWADPASCQILDLTGRAVAMIKFDGVFDREGHQIGWWYGDHIRDLLGRLLLFMRGGEIPGLNLPLLRPYLDQPKVRRLLPQGTLRRIEKRPQSKPEWSPLPLISDRLQWLRGFLEHYGAYSEASL
jgi:hypothetical protein